MDTSVDILNQGALFDPVMIAVLVGVVGIMIMLLGAIYWFIQERNDPLRKLATASAAVVEAEGSKRIKSRKPTKSRAAFLESYAQMLEPQERGEMEDARLEMIRAGFYNEDAVRIFSFAKLAGGLGGLALGFVLYNLFTDPEEPSMQQMLMMIGLPGMVGYFLPKMHANSKRQKRIDQIAMGFPDALDMMLVCVEAGQTMDQAIPRVGKELRSSYEFLADELETVAHQIKAGKDRATVLREFANRCDNDDVMAFVNTLITAQSFGKSISDALRVYTLEMRDKRVMVAEEKANKIPTKMTLCTMAFTLPPLLIVLVGPAIVTILDVVNQ